MVIILNRFLFLQIHLVFATNYMFLLVPNDQKLNETGNSSKHFQTFTAE
jgi:hypothetical protein